MVQRASQSVTNDQTKKLIAQYRSGSGDALDLLLRQYTPLVEGIVLNQFGWNVFDPPEEMVTDGISGVYESVGKYDSSRSNSRGYLLTAAHHSIMDGIRFRHPIRRAAGKPLSLDELYFDEPDEESGELKALLGMFVNDTERDPRDIVQGKEAVAYALASLTAQQRQVIGDHYWRGIDIIRVEVLGKNGDVTPGRVSSLHQEALRRMRRRLGG